MPTDYNEFILSTGGTVLALARESIKALARLRDRQSETIRELTTQSADFMGWN